MKLTNKIILLIMTSLISSLGISSISHSFQNELNGFNEFKWGSNFDNFGDMNLIIGDTDVKAITHHKDVTAYSQAGDTLSFEVKRFF